MPDIYSSVPSAHAQGCVDTRAPQARHSQAKFFHFVQRLNGCGFYAELTVDWLDLRLLVKISFLASFRKPRHEL